MIERIFWGWHEPVLDRALSLLSTGYTGGELDLSDTLIIVPTSEAARRLKESLARATAARAGAAVVPHVWAPERALMTDADRAAAASSVASLFAWVEVLQRIDFTQFTRLFPHPPQERSWAWCVATAEMLQDLGATLGAGGLRFADVLTCPQARPDWDRWQELAALEVQYQEALTCRSLRDTQRLKATRAAEPILPEGVHRVLVLACPDLPALLETWLQQVAKRVPVTVCVQAPEALSDAFDAIGRPHPEWWADAARLPAPLSNDHVQVSSSAAAQADEVIKHLAALAQSARTAAGVCDAEVTAALQERLALEEVRVFQPDGVAPQSVGLWHALECLRDLVATHSWRSFASLLRVDAVRSALTSGGEGSGSSLLVAADEFAQTHMPVTLEHALDLLPDSEDAAWRKLRDALDQAQRIIATFDRCFTIDALRSFLIRVHGEHLFAANAPADRLLLDLAEAVLDAAEEVAVHADEFELKPSGAEAFSLVLDRVRGSMLSEPRGEVDLVLQGWLELLWEPSPCLVVAGMNEEHVPGILVSHPFLPDSLRAALGLSCQAGRYARDAYVLHALAEQRVDGGALRVLCGQWSERGDALRPSRLLFRGPDAALPARVEHLFPRDENHAAVPEPPRSLAWKLRPRSVPVNLKRVNASLLKSYLTCPFRFYLSNVLNMSAIDSRKQELAANEFGSLIHTAFQRMLGDKAIAGSENANDIAQFLCAEATREARDTYGRRLPMLVRLQLESALQRLRAAAEIEAASRADGWRIVEVEKLLDGELQIEGLPFRGKIDRVEHRTHNGRVDVRLIDFKTGDHAKNPEDAHARDVSRSRSIGPEMQWRIFSPASGGKRLWEDLQLPLYAAAMRAAGGGDVQVGYFNLPKSVQDTRLSVWDEFDRSWCDDALRCAGEIVVRIRKGEFWPPASMRYDDYAEIFLGDVENSVEQPMIPMEAAPADV